MCIELPEQSTDRRSRESLLLGTNRRTRLGARMAPAAFPAVEPANMHTRTASFAASGGLSSAAPARGGMLCRCSASRLSVDTRASYPSGQTGLPPRPAPGVSGSTVLDPAAPQPLGAGVQTTRVAAVPVSAPRPIVRPYRPSLWGVWRLCSGFRLADVRAPGARRSSRARPRRHVQVQRRGAGWEAGHGRLCAGGAPLTCFVLSNLRPVCTWCVSHSEWA